MRALVVVGATAASSWLGLGCGPSSQAGDCTDSLLAGDLVITEVFADAKAPPGGSGTDEGKEWFEIYNASDRPLELEGLTIAHARPDGSRAKSHVMKSVTIAPGQYFTLGNAAPDLLAPYVDYGYGAALGDMFNTDGGQLTLACGSDEIDRTLYEAISEGRSRQLTAAQPPDYTLNDDPLSWCEAKDAEFEVANFGTPGAENDCTPVIAGQCNDAGVMRDVVPPAVGDLVITEVMPKPSAVSATTGQWFEVYATRDVDLNGVGLDRASDSSDPTEITSSDCVRVAAGSYSVFARSADSAVNGGLTALAAFPFSINPSGVPGDVQLVYNGAVLDAVTWSASTSGRSLSLDPDLFNPTANDDASNFCNGTTVYNGTDYGTPGAANPQCTAQPQAGQCLDNGTPRPIVKPAAGQLVITEFLANAAGTGTDGAQEWFEITNIGGTAFDLNGLGLKGGTTTVNTIQSVDCKRLPALGFALFAHGTDPTTNGGLPAVDATFTFPLGSRIEVLDGTTSLDVVTFGSAADGVSKQLKPDATTTTDNDVATNFCDAVPVLMYGTAANYGTPKEINACPP